MKYYWIASTVEMKTIICASWWLSTATILNKVRFLIGALSLIEIHMCCTAML